MVGRRVEARGHVDRASVAATVDPLAALDRLEGGGSLSFQGALRGGEAPPSDVEKKIAAMPKPDPAAAAKAIDKPVARPLDKAVDKAGGKPPDKPVAQPLDKAVAQPLDKPIEKTAEADKPIEKKAEADKPIEKKPEADKPTDKKADADKPLDKKAEGKKPEAKKADDKPARFTLQLSAFQDKAEAQAYLESIKASGFAAYVTEGEVDGKQYFRVRTGSYKSVEAANDAKLELERATKKSAIVTKL
jgi:cell division septation protein DedD